MSSQDSTKKLRLSNSNSDVASSENTPESSLNFGGLSENVQNLLRKCRGIERLYDWQEECLRLQMSSHRNLIVCLPTSGGKTLLAEILILKELLHHQRDAIFVLPFVSIVQEKIKSLQQLGLELDFLVEEYAGSRGRLPPIRRRRRKSIYVATIEKSRTLINSLVKCKRLNDVGLVVIDELHMIGEGGSRGATLEQVITTLKVASASAKIVGLSATLQNIDELAAFMCADVYTNNFRPVPLSEFVKVGNLIYRVNGDAEIETKLLEFSRQMANSPKDIDGVTNLVEEVVPEASCLVFCPTRKNAENVATLLAKTLSRDLLLHKVEEKKKLLQRLASDCNGNVCPILRQCIPYGVSYHHSGLTADERGHLQDAFLSGALCIICCTSTLAAGVNLPAKRVILRSCYVGNGFISKQQYKQMIGRAGRAGMDCSGESFLIISSKNLSQTRKLLRGGMEECESSLFCDNGKGFRHYVLSIIALELVKSKADLLEFVERSFASIQRKRLELDIQEVTETAIDHLAAANFIKVTSNDSMDQLLKITKFGVATIEGGVDADAAPQILSDLKTSANYMVLSSHLHLLYCVVASDQLDGVVPNWEVYYEEYCSATDEERKVFDLLSITEAYLLKRKMGTTKVNEAANATATRLYLALILHRLWRQESVWSVAERFSVTRGFVQSLLQSSAAFALALSRFVEHLEELWAFQRLLPEVAKKIGYCTRSELIPLMEIQGVKQARASQLYRVGYRTLASVANAKIDSLITEIDNLSRRQAAQIVTSAKMLQREKIEILFEEAEEILADPSNGFCTSVDEILSTMSQAA